MIHNLSCKTVSVVMFLFTVTIRGHFHRIVFTRKSQRNVFGSCRLIAIGESDLICYRVGA